MRVLKEDSIREDALKRHRILRDILKNYLEFRDIVTLPEQQVTGQAGRTRAIGNHRGMDGVFDYTYSVRLEDGTVKKIDLSISFWDLQGMLKKLSPRKREAVFYNVILDQRQKDVAAIMGITTVSVGQYVDQAMLQLVEEYFGDDGLISDDALEGVV